MLRREGIFNQTPLVTLQKGPDSSAPTALRKPFGVDGGIGGPRPPIPPSTPNLGEPPQVASRPEELRFLDYLSIKHYNLSCCYRVKETDKVMKPDIDKVQVILGVVVLLGCILFGAFFLLGKLLIANGFSYATMFVFVIVCFYTGLRHISQASKEGVKISWYKQPWILLSILLFVSMAIIFISNYPRIYG